MNWEFRQSDAEILTRILQSARKNYLKESRVSIKSNFNILRVLSAYKDLSWQFSSRKEHIYNCIIGITKHYDPQTYNQWSSAVNELLSMNRRQTKTKTPINRLTGGYQSNQTINEFNYYQFEDEGDRHCSSDLCINIQNGLNSYDSTNKFHVQRIQGNNYHRSRAFGTKTNHYISFEPSGVQNKQNFNSQNTSKHQDFKTEHYKCDSLPTRATGEQSFIHYLPQSSGSPIVCSKLTNLTKQMTEMDEEDENEENVVFGNAAKMYHSINLKMKSFSAILANCQAFGEFQALHAKAKYLRKVIYAKRVVDSLKLSSQFTRDRRQCLQTVDTFCNLKLVKKSFNVLSALYQLKIKKTKNIEFNLSALKPIGFEFLLSVMFGHEDQMTESVDNPKSLRHKRNYFQSIEDSEKMSLISEYFSTNVKTSKEQISQFFIYHNQARLKQSFQFLRNNALSFKEEIEKVKILRKKTALQLILRLQNDKSFKKNSINIMQEKANNKLKDKCFKALLQFKKCKQVYAKRQQYLRGKHQELVARTILDLWREATQQSLVLKDERKNRFQKACLLIKKVYNKKLIADLQQIYTKTIRYEQQQQNKENFKIVKSVFDALKIRAKQRKIYFSIKQLVKNNMKTLILKEWKKKLRIGKALSLFSRIMKKKSFYKIINESDFIRKQQELKKIMTQSWMNKTLRQIRLNYFLDKKEREEKSKQIISFIQIEEFKSFIRICRNDLKTKIKEKQKNQQKQKTQVVELHLNNKKISQFFGKLRLQLSLKKSMKNKQSIIQSAMGNRNFKGNTGLTFVRCLSAMKKDVFQQLSNNLALKNKNQKLEQFLIISTQSQVKQRLRSLHQQTLDMKNLFLLIQNRNRKEQQKMMQALKSIYKNYQQKKNQSQKKHEKSLKFKSLLSLAKAVIQTKTQCLDAEKKIEQVKKLNFSMKFILNLRQKVQWKVKKSKVSKIHFLTNFKSLPEKDNLGEKMCEVVNLRKRKFYCKLETIFMNSKTFSSLQPSAQYLQKVLSLHRLEGAVFRHIIQKKQLYTAYKFRALSLCKSALLCLKLNAQKHKSGGQQVPVLHVAKNTGRHEQLSTEYSYF